MVLNRLLKPLARQRISELIVGNGLSDDGFPPEKVHNVLSANDARTIVLLNELQPDVVVVNGTRIISGEVLNCVAVPFINTHMGITPKYRGVHGGYWALASGDRDNCGVTVHLVDQGIDTGDVLYQGLIATTNDDTFNTYPVHQIAAAIPLMIKALNDLRLGQLISRPGVLPSQLWSHPTLWNYFWNWVSKGVR
jgi:methionyl-tRNA formyltransferase